MMHYKGTKKEHRSLDRKKGITLSDWRGNYSTDNSPFFVNEPQGTISLFFFRLIVPYKVQATQSLEHGNKPMFEMGVGSNAKFKW